MLQVKTYARRRIEITGELKDLIDRIMSRKSEHKVGSTRLISLIHMGVRHDSVVANDEETGSTGQVELKVKPCS